MYKNTYQFYNKIINFVYIVVIINIHLTKYNIFRSEIYLYFLTNKMELFAINCY